MASYRIFFYFDFPGFNFAILFEKNLFEHRLLNEMKKNHIKMPGARKRTSFGVSAK